MLLLINLLSRSIHSYPVVLNVTIGSDLYVIGLGNDGWSDFTTRFNRDVCKMDQSVSMQAKSMNPYSGPSSDAVTAENSVQYNSKAYYQCEYLVNEPSNKAVSCTKVTASSCPSDACQIHIIVKCADKTTVVLAWDTTQQPTVLSFTDDVPVIKCCKTSPTTTEITTVSTAPTQTTTGPTITTSTESSDIILQSTVSTSANININNTHTDTSNQQTGTNDAGSQISGQYIGIIVGAVVTAILITIVIACILWKVKTRREKNRRNEIVNSVTPVSGTLEETRVDELRRTPNVVDPKVSKTVAHVSPFQSHEVDSQRKQTAGDYTYIDVNSAASGKTNTILTFPSPTVGELYETSTTVEADGEIESSEYSHLGTDKVRLQNPYNLLNQQNSSTVIQPIIIPVLQKDNHQIKNCLETSHVRPINNHIREETKEETGAGESSSLYSKLGESHVAPDITYNCLQNTKVEPITEAHLPQYSGTTNQSSEIKSETTLSANHKRPLFPHATNDKSVDIVDVSPYDYAQVPPKAQWEKSFYQLKETTIQAIMPASGSGHGIHHTAKSDEGSTEIDMAKETVKHNHYTSETGEGPIQVYENAVYSMHEISDERNISSSLEDVAYANMV
ncbi:hypothetical protein BsWGS_25334 [Bradybaena similaris]